MRTMEKAVKLRFSLPEIAISTTLYIIFMVRCFYTVYRISLEKEDMLSFDLHPSWWFGRKMDDSDYEWRYFAEYYSNTMYWYLGHTLVGLAINHHLEKGRLYVNIAYSLAALSVILGVKQLTFLICNVCFVYLTVIVTRRKALVWLASVVMLGLLNMEATSSFIMGLCQPDPMGKKYMALVYAMSTCNLRLVSLGVDLIEDLDKHDHLESFYRVLAYTLYFPTFISGPFLAYKPFINQIIIKQDPLSWQKVKWFVSESFLMIFWWMLMEISLHYIYSTALQQEEYFLLSADNMTIFALCLAQAALFNLKYLVLFGVPSLFAELDGITMPPRACCLLLQNRASDIWRTFDIGLYNFIIRYMYIPLGGRKVGLSQQVLTMFLCFMFIGFWHGAALNIFIWVVINFLAIFLENIHHKLLQSRQWKNIVVQFGSEAAFRLENLLLAPIGILSLWSMFVFLGGQNVGYNLYKKMLRNTNLESRITLIALAYCHIIFSRSLLDGSLFSYIRTAGRCFTLRRNSDSCQENLDNSVKKNRQKHY